MFRNYLSRPEIPHTVQNIDSWSRSHIGRCNTRFYIGKIENRRNLIRKLKLPCRNDSIWRPERYLILSRSWRKTEHLLIKKWAYFLFYITPKCSKRKGIFVLNELCSHMDITIKTVIFLYCGYDASRAEGGQSIHERRILITSDSAREVYIIVALINKTTLNGGALFWKEVYCKESAKSNHHVLWNTFRFLI